MKYFDNPLTLEQLKKQYKALAMIHHPDKGGELEDMQALNEEYDILFQQLKNIHVNVSGEAYTSTTGTMETPDEYKNIINTLINLNGLNIEICGSWIWLTGDTRQHREVLKCLNFRWSNSKYAWYYHTSDYKKTSKKTFTLNEIRGLYGSKTVTGSPQLELQLV